MIGNNDRLKEIIIGILESDIERSLWIDDRLERTWMWWRRTDLVNDRNEETLRVTKEKIKDL